MVSSLVSMIMVASLFFGSIVGTPVSDFKSGEINFRADVKLNQPLPEELADEFGHIDFDSLWYEFNVKYKYEGGKKLSAWWEMILPADSEPDKVQFWGKFDLDDRNNPKIYCVYKEAEDEKYSVIDIQYPLVSGSVLPFGTLINEEVFNTLTAIFNENVPDVEDGTAVLGEESLKEMLRQITLLWARTILKSTSRNIMLSGYSVYDIDENRQINNFFDTLKGVKVFDDKALVLKTTYDDNGNPKSIDYSININANLFDLFSAFGGPLDDEWTKENTKVDLSLRLNYALSNLGEDVNLDFPNITPENSINVSYGLDLPEIDVNSVNVVVDGTFTQIKNTPFFDSDTLYLPLREMLNIKGLENEDIVWDNGVVYINAPNYKATLTVGSEKIVINNADLNLNKKVVLKDDTTFIPATALEMLQIGSISNTFFDEDDNLTGCVISMYPFPKIDKNTIRFLIPDERFEEYLVKAGDAIGVNVEVIFGPEENFLEYVRLIIAAGDPMVLLGKFDAEFIQQLMDINAINPPVKVNDEYSILIPKVIKNLDAAMAISKMFVEQMLEE